MFAKSAQWHDTLYSFKNYAKDSAAIITLLKQEHPAANSVLDVACGTAEHGFLYKSRKRASEPPHGRGRPRGSRVTFGRIRTDTIRRFASKRDRQARLGGFIL